MMDVSIISNIRLKIHPKVCKTEHLITFLSHISSYYLIFRNYPTGPSGCAGVGGGGRGEKLAVRDLQRGGRRGAGHGQGVQAGQGRHRGHGPPQGLQVGRCPGQGDGGDHSCRVAAG